MTFGRPELGFIRNVYSAVADTSGQGCFFNIVTGQLVWELPVGALCVPFDEEGWFELYSDQHALPYYYHSATKQVTWERPANVLIIPLTAVQRTEKAFAASPVSSTFTQFGQDKSSMSNSATMSSLSSYETASSAAHNRAYPRKQLSFSENRAIRSKNANKAPSKLEQLTPPPKKSDILVELTPSSSASLSPFKSPFRFFLKRASPAKSFSSNANDPGLPVTPSPVPLTTPLPQVLVSSASKTSLVQEGSPIRAGKRSFPSMKIKRLSTGDHLILPSPIRKELSKFSIEGYANLHFQQHRTGLVFRRRVPLTTLANWQGDSLDKSLLPLSRSLQDQAVSAFRRLQEIMLPGRATIDEDSIVVSTLKQSWTLANLRNAQTLTEIAIKSVDLRDELYLQIVKQLSNNPSTASVVRGWQLLQIYSAIFPWSKSLEEHLKQFLENAQSHAENVIKLMAGYCLDNLPMTSVKGARGRPPSLKEIEIQTLAAFNPNCFGQTLEDTVKLQIGLTDLPIPVCLVWLANAILSLGGPKTRGIFRVPTDVEIVHDHKARMNQGEYSLHANADVHLVASLFKTFFRDLKQPLIPLNVYAPCLKHADDIVNINDIISDLPLLNRKVLAFLITFLQQFTLPECTHLSKMDSTNLAMIWVPNIIRSQTSTLSVAFANAQREQVFVKTLIDFFSPKAVDLGTFAFIEHPMQLPATGRLVRPCSVEGILLL